MEADGGFILVKRTDYRRMHGRNALVSAPKTGNSHTCVVDAVWHLSLFTPMRGLFTHEQLLALMPEVGATRFEIVGGFVLQHGYELHYIDDGEFTQQPGGNELAVLQERERLLVVKLIVENDDGTRFVEDHAGVYYDQAPHCVAYNGKQIIDNMSNNKVVTIQESDRGDAGSARVVFNALYKGYCKVFVTAVYELRPTTEAPRQ